MEGHKIAVYRIDEVASTTFDEAIQKANGRKFGQVLVSSSSDATGKTPDQLAQHLAGNRSHSDGSAISQKVFVISSSALSSQNAFQIFEVDDQGKAISSLKTDVSIAGTIAAAVHLGETTLELEKEGMIDPEAVMLPMAPQEPQPPLGPIRGHQAQAQGQSFPGQGQALGGGSGQQMGMGRGMGMGGGMGGPGGPGPGMRGGQGPPRSRLYLLSSGDVHSSLMERSIGHEVVSYTDAGQQRTDTIVDELTVNQQGQYIGRNGNVVA